MGRDFQVGSAGGRIDIVLAGPNSPAGAVSEGAQLIRAPSNKGVLLFRRVIPSDEEYALINAERREAKCMPIIFQSINKTMNVRSLP